jgi:hypothetical protein
MSFVADCRLINLALHFGPDRVRHMAPNTSATLILGGAPRLREAELTPRVPVRR